MIASRTAQSAGAHGDGMMSTGSVRRIAAAFAGGIALVVACVGAAVGASGQDTLMSPEARGVSQAVTAAELAAWGRAHQDPGALIMAARLLAEVPVRQGGDSTGELLLNPDRLLDEAATLATGNDPLIAAIDRLRNTGAGRTRGVNSSPFGRGPIFTVKELRARETYGFDVDARAGEVLRVAAIGDGDTNIDLSVKDARGAVVCRDGYGDHYPVCTISPSRPGKMRVDIVNRGDVWTKVQILSN